MATTSTHYYAGPAVVRYEPRIPASGLYDTSVELGINREAIPVIIQPKFLDVPSDDWAGPDGVPSDAQFMGATAIVQLSLTKVIVANCDKVIDGLGYSGQTAGVLPQMGEFIRSAFAGRLTLDGTEFSGRSDRKSMVFTHAFCRGGGAVAQGTRYSSYDMQFECWMNTSTARLLYTLTYS